MDKLRKNVGYKSIRLLRNRFGYWLILPVGLLISSPTSVVAQCPDAPGVYQQVETISADTDFKRMIDQLLRLDQTINKCGLKNDSVRAKLVHVLGRTYWYAGDLKNGVRYTQQAIRLNKLPSKTARRANLANSYYNLGRIVAEQTRTEQALRLFDQAIQIAGNYPEKYTQAAKSYAHKAYLYFVLGDYEHAQHNAELGYAFARQANDGPQMIENLVQQVEALLKLENYTAAEKKLLSALQLSQAKHDPSQTATVYANLAKLSTVTGKYPSVIRYYKAAFSANKQTNNRYGCARMLTNLGYFYQTKLRNYAEALTLYQEALTYVDDQNDRLRLLDNIGYIYRLQRNYPRALTYYQQALMSASIQFKDARTSINPSAQAVRLLSQKEYLLTVIQDKADTWLDYAIASGKDIKRLHNALNTYAVADTMIDFMRWEHTGQQSKLFWREKTRGMYERAIETCFQLNKAEQAFRFMEKSRAVMLTDKLNELGAQQRLSPEQAREEQRLRQRVNTQQNDLAGLSSDSARYAPVRTALLASQDSLADFLKQLETSNSAYYQLKYDNATPSLTELQHYLKQRQAALVTYFVGDSALYILAVTNAGTILRKQPIVLYNQTLHQFAPLLATAEALPTTTEVNRFLRLSHDLYNQLLAPLHLPKGRVVVSPDGFFIPFDALSRSASQGQYVLDDYAFSYIYSARLLLRKRESNQPSFGFGRHDFLGVAPVDFAPSLKQVMLPNSDTALEPIANRFGSSLLLTHESATRRAFLTQAADAQVIQLFTHAIADSTQQEPKLYFADSTLQLTDLENGALPRAQLVVLAACKTGIGANQRGEGVFSLARGFAALGVPCVLTTLWSVQNEATYQLTDLFYQYLDKGFPKDVALQRAKQDWFKTTEGLNQLPTFWAGLIIVGDTEPLSQSHYAWWAIGMSLLVIAGLSGWLIWRRRQRVTLLR